MKKKNRLQLNHPLTGERLSFSGLSPRAAATVRDRFETWRVDLELGLVTEQEVAEGVARLQRGGPLMVRDAWAAHVEAHPASRKMLESYWLRHLAPHFEGKACVELTELVMVAWQQALERGGTMLGPTDDPDCPPERTKPLGAKSIRNIFDCLRSAIATHVRSGALARIPGEPVNRTSVRAGHEQKGGGYQPPKPGVPDREAARTIWELHAIAVEARRYDAEDAAGVLHDLTERVVVLAFLGLRQGEGCAIGWDDLDGFAGPRAIALHGVTRDDVTVTIRHQALDQWRTRQPECYPGLAVDRPRAPPKHRRTNTLLVHPSAVEALRSQRAKLEALGWYRADGPVFPASRGPFVGSWRNQAMLVQPEIVRELVRRAGLPNVPQWVTHGLKHSFASLELIASGGDLRATMQRTRHTSIRTLERYLHKGGRGLVHSEVEALPALPPASTVVVPEAPILEDGITAVTSEAAAVYNEAVKAADREAAARKHGVRLIGTFAEMFEPWHKAGRTTRHPKGVTSRAKGAYVRTYQRERRRLRAQGLSEQEARAKARTAGNTARQRVFAAWSTWLQLGERKGRLPKAGEDREPHAGHDAAEE